MGASDFSDWLTALTNLQSSVSKDLEEIRQQKAEIQQLRSDMFNQLAQGRVIRDDRRLVLSAPEIIIGNVDGTGILYQEGGSIIIRGQNVGLEGVGTSGSVETKATTISQTAIDPGIDGIEEVVRSGSSIIQQAKRITLQSNDCANDGYFSQSPRTTGDSGIRIHADQRLEIDSSVSNDRHSTEVSDRITSTTSAVTSLTTDSISAMTTATTLIGEMEALLALEDPLCLDEPTMRTTVLELDSLTEQFNALLPSVYDAINRAASSMSQLAEANRRLKALQAEQTDLSTASATFKDDTTGASLSITAEQMDIASIDGDDNIRDNAEAAIHIQTGKLDITTLKADGSLIDDSYVSIATHDVDISTINVTPAEGGDEGGDSGDSSDSTYETVGTVSIKAKEVLVSAFDNGDDGLVQTAESSFGVRTESTSFLSLDSEGNSSGTFVVQANKMFMGSKDSEGNSSGAFNVNAKDFTIHSVDKDGTATGTATILAADTAINALDKDGKAIGQLSLNGKDVFIKSMDTSTDDGSDSSLTSGGNLVLVAENMYVGRTSDDIVSTQLQLTSDKTAIFGTTTAEMQQGDAEAIVQLDGGNVALSGSKVESYGDGTVNGKTTFKADVTMKGLTADNVEAKKSFKSKNISDGMAVGGASSSSSLSAKLSKADAPTPQTRTSDNENESE